MTGASTAQERVRDAARRHAWPIPRGAPRGMGDVPPRRPPNLQATVLRLLRDKGLLEAYYQQERRHLAARRKAAFATEPTGTKQV